LDGINNIGDVGQLGKLIGLGPIDLGEILGIPRFRDIQIRASSFLLNRKSFKTLVYHLK